MALAALIISSTPAWAVRNDETSMLRPEAMDDAQLGQAVARLAAEVGEKGPDASCRLVPYFDEMERRRKEADISMGAAFYRGLCFAGRHQPAEALIQFERIEGFVPTGAAAGLLPAADIMSVYAAIDAKDWKRFTAHGLHIAARNNPEEFAQLDARTFGFGLARAEKAQADSVATGFAKASSFPRLPVELRQTFAYRASRSLAASGDLDLAKQLVASIDGPSTIVTMLADREFSAFWPDLDKRANPHLRLVLDNDVKRRRQKLAKNPADMDAFASVVSALVTAGRYQDAVDLAQKVDHSPAGLEKIVEGEAWALNAEVKALDRLGRGQDADRIFDALNALAWDGRGWMVNFAINRADRLVGQRRWQDALPAAERAVTVAEKQGSPYAKEVALVDWLCAARGADAKRDVSERWAIVQKNWKDNVSSAVQAAMCLGEPTTAARFLREGLGDPETRSNTILMLQPKEADLFRDADFMSDDVRAMLNSDKDLRASFDLYAREIPIELLPER